MALLEPRNAALTRSIFFLALLHFAYQYRESLHEQAGWRLNHAALAELAQHLSGRPAGSGHGGEAGGGDERPPYQAAQEQQQPRIVINMVNARLVSAVAEAEAVAGAAAASAGGVAAAGAQGPAGGAGRQQSSSCSRAPPAASARSGPSRDAPAHCTAPSAPSAPVSFSVRLFPREAGRLVWNLSAPRQPPAWAGHLLLRPVLLQALVLTPRYCFLLGPALEAAGAALPVADWWRRQRLPSFTPAELPGQQLAEGDALAECRLETVPALWVLTAPGSRGLLPPPPHRARRAVCRLTPRPELPHLLRAADAGGGAGGAGSGAAVRQQCYDCEAERACAQQVQSVGEAAPAEGGGAAGAASTEYASGSAHGGGAGATAGAAAPRGSPSPDGGLTLVVWEEIDTYTRARTAAARTGVGHGSAHRGSAARRRGRSHWTHGFPPGRPPGWLPGGLSLGAGADAERREAAARTLAQAQGQAAGGAADGSGWQQQQQAAQEEQEEGVETTSRLWSYLTGRDGGALFFCADWRCDPAAFGPPQSLPPQAQAWQQQRYSGTARGVSGGGSGHSACAGERGVAPGRVVAGPVVAVSAVLRFLWRWADAAVPPLLLPHTAALRWIWPLWGAELGPARKTVAVVAAFLCCYTEWLLAARMAARLWADLEDARGPRLDTETAAGLRARRWCEAVGRPLGRGRLLAWRLGSAPWRRPPLGQPDLWQLALLLLLAVLLPPALPEGAQSGFPQMLLTCLRSSLSAGCAVAWALSLYGQARRRWMRVEVATRASKTLLQVAASSRQLADSAAALSLAEMAFLAARLELERGRQAALWQLHCIVRLQTFARLPPEACAYVQLTVRRFRDAWRAEPERPRQPPRQPPAREGPHGGEGEADHEVPVHWPEPLQLPALPGAPTDARHAAQQPRDAAGQGPGVHGRPTAAGGGAGARPPSPAAAAAAGEGLVPRGFVCPITHCVMRQPALLLSPQLGGAPTYERDAIREWLRRSRVDPRSNTPLTTYRLMPNDDLRRAIEDWAAEQGAGRRAARTERIRQVAAAGPESNQMRR